MNHIIDYIGANKLAHSELTWNRLNRPQPGDVIDFGEDYKNNPYPFNTARYGRVDSRKSYWDITGNEIVVCCELGSCFWGDGYIDISGGPFSKIDTKNIDPTHNTMGVSMWNWGNNLPGADMGVYYTVERPVFKWIDKKLE